MMNPPELPTLRGGRAEKEQLLIFRDFQTAQGVLHGNDHVSDELDFRGVTVRHKLTQPAVQQRPRLFDLYAKQLVSGTPQGVDDVDHNLQTGDTVSSLNMADVGDANSHSFGKLFLRHFPIQPDRSYS